MLTAFPAPVLSIASDAVKDLEGRDVSLGFWSCRFSFAVLSIIHMLIFMSTLQVFTKCKESLQDGRRLENISWRLWYREMMKDLSLRDTALCPPLDSSSASDTVLPAVVPVHPFFAVTVIIW
jgi:Fungal protein of unknown function (DUF1752)